MNPVLFVILFFFGSSAHGYYAITKREETYNSTWESLDARPLPSWYDEEKIGIFIHWGVFSVPSFGSEWFWHQWTEEKNNGTLSEFMHKNYPPGFSYQDFGKEFTAEFYDPNQWAELFNASGAKYVVLTSKHHEGYTLWPSKYSFSWNAMDVGSHRNLAGELATAIQTQTDLHFGFYHSLYEWYNPLYLADKAKNFTTDLFVVQKTLPELYELVENYHPEIIWSDGEWEAEDTYWHSKEFLAWLYNESPVRDTVVVNDRWGRSTQCTHGGFFNCADRYNPGILQTHKWENALTIDRESWGYRRNAALKDYLSIDEILKELVITVSCGGNMLINIGPTKEGTIIPIFEERLRQMGKWLEINGEAIYRSSPWTLQNDTIDNSIWYTKKSETVYAIALYWPNDGYLTLTGPKLSQYSEITLLAYPVSRLEYQINNTQIKITLPEKAKLAVSWAYVFRLTQVLN